MDWVQVMCLSWREPRDRNVLVAAVCVDLWAEQGPEPDRRKWKSVGYDCSQGYPENMWQITEEEG